MREVTTRQQRTKRFSLALISLLMITALCAMYLAPSHADGTPSEPEKSGGYYLLASSSDLVWFRNKVISETSTSSLKAKLTADIDLEGSITNQWEPIGTNAHRFEGTFDGDGHTIEGLYISRDAPNQGLFGKISDTYAEVKNLTVSGEVTGNGNTALVVGDNSGGKVTYCTAKGTVTGTGAGPYYVGLVVGTNDGNGKPATVSNCTANGTVNGTQYVGLVVGQNTARTSGSNPDGTATISNCTASGTVNGTRYVGLVGENNANGGTAVVTNCIAKNGLVSGDSSVGGIVGVNVVYKDGSVASVVNCVEENQTVSGDEYIGGIVGSNQAYNNGIATVSNCAASCDVITGTDSGGVVGQNYNGIVSNCGWLSGAGVPNVGIGLNNNVASTDHVVSYDSVAADKIVVACLPDPTSLTLTPNGTGVITLKTYPANTATSFTTHLSGDVTLTVAPSDKATAAITGNTINVTAGSSLGSALLSMGLNLKPTWFNGTFDNVSTDVALNLAAFLSVEATPPTITTTSLDKAIAGKSYTYQMTATGTSPITWTATGLPSGLAISTDGKITGIPAASGDSSVTFTATNAAGDNSKTLTLTVVEQPPVEQIEPKKYTDKETAANDSKIKSSDLVLSGDNNVYITDTFAQGALTSLEQDGVKISKILPVVKGELTTAGKIAGLKFQVKGSEFGVTNTTEAKVMKILSDGTGKLFTMITNEADITDKTAAIYETDMSKMATAIEVSKDYILVAYVKDAPNGFDLDNTTNREVIDPVVILKPDGTPKPKKSSSGGCSAGFGMLALLALLPMVMRKKK